MGRDMEGLRHLLSIGDLGRSQVLALLDLAEELDHDRRAWSSSLQGLILANLFLEPSTRTRLSFETAMLRLGGEVITVAGARGSSMDKGESLLDTLRAVDHYADLIVLRHQAVGAAQRGAAVVRHPLLNAGDGSGEHPSQALTDMLCLRRECGRLEELTILLVGDLKNGRTVHSLVRGLLPFGTRFIGLFEPGLGLTPEFLEEGLLAQAFGVRHLPLQGLFTIRGEWPAQVVLVDRLERLPPAGTPLILGAGEVDALYVTRLQRERLPEAPERSLPQVDKSFLSAPALRRAAVLHPLPRREEVDPRLDLEPRVAWFRQLACGLPVRMALLLWAAGHELRGS